MFFPSCFYNIVENGLFAVPRRDSYVGFCLYNEEDEEYTTKKKIFFGQKVPGSHKVPSDILLSNLHKMLHQIQPPHSLFIVCITYVQVYCVLLTFD